MHPVLGVALARRRGLSCRGGAFRSRSGSRCLPAELATFMGRRMAGVLAASRARFLAAAIVLVDGRPGPALGLVLRHTPLFVAFRDVVGLTLLFVRVFRLVAAR